MTLASFTLISAIAVSSAHTGPERFDLDRNHTRIGFAVKHMMVTNVRGVFNDFTGHIVFDPADLAASSVEVAIQAASVDTNVERRDNHLRSPDFFDVERFPAIHFRSTRIERMEGGFVAIGDLTIRDVTREVRFPFELNGPIEFGDGRKRLGASARLTVTRQDWGLTYSRALEAVAVVGDEVTIEIDVEAATPRTTASP